MKTFFYSTWENEETRFSFFKKTIYRLHVAFKITVLSIIVAHYEVRRTSTMHNSELRRIFRFRNVIMFFLKTHLCEKKALNVFLSQICIICDCTTMYGFFFFFFFIVWIQRGKVATKPLFLFLLNICKCCHSHSCGTKHSKF